MTVSFIIQTGTLLGAKQSSWCHSAVARCPGLPYLLQEQRHSRSGWEETGARATGLLTHLLPHSFIHPATLALASTWGPMEESPPLNSRRGRRDVYQGEQTPRGAPEANSVTPSSAVPRKKRWKILQSFALSVQKFQWEAESYLLISYLRKRDAVCVPWPLQGFYCLTLFPGPGKEKGNTEGRRVGAVEFTDQHITVPFGSLEFR